MVTTFAMVLTGCLVFRRRSCSKIRRVGEVSKLFADAVLIVLSAFTSTLATDQRITASYLFPG
ncbi:adenylyl-sulfate kinase [Marinobacter vulgaris]|uniref:adenylyl-sulfate kinase n=2 Tax=Marinobacter vulgaris TaxID=1928331 RepID=UPI00313829DA